MKNLWGSKIQVTWLIANAFAFGLMIFSFQSDVWEAYTSLFVVSAAAQTYTLLRKRSH
jgi:hypothetical protein